MVNGMTAADARGVTGINASQKALIDAYLQGAVYVWTALRPGDWFAARDLVGGVNANWTGTPLQVLYDKHIVVGKSSPDAVTTAGQDLGWLLFGMLIADGRNFDTKHEAMVRKYLLI